MILDSQLLSRDYWRAVTRERMQEDPLCIGMASNNSKRVARFNISLNVMEVMHILESTCNQSFDVTKLIKSNNNLNPEAHRFIILESY